MERPRVAVNAPVFAAAIRIDAGLEPDIRTVIVSNNSARAVAKELCAWQRIVFRVPIRVRLEMNLFETVRRIASGAAMGGGWVFCGHGREQVFSIQYSVFRRDQVPMDFRSETGKPQWRIASGSGLGAPA